MKKMSKNNKNDKNLKINLAKIPFGSLEAFNVLVEIPQGSNLKYEFDEVSGTMKVDFVFSAVGGSASGGDNLVFPFNYGFIPHTLGGDGDALDDIVLSSAPIPSGSVVKCRAVGMFETVDTGEVDNKLIVVPVDDILAKKYQDISDLPKDSLQKWTDLYMEIARQKNKFKRKFIEVKGLKNKQVALEEIRKSLITT
jgi:inorganic pyrophosphatase